MRIDVSTVLLLAAVAWTSPAVRGHSLVAPAEVEVDAQGAFRFEALFTIGPGSESLSFYVIDGSAELDLPTEIADGRCISMLPEGHEIAITVDGSLVDPARGGIATVQLATCGVSGTQTAFSAEIAVVPARQHGIYWVESGAVHRARLDGGVPRQVVDAPTAAAVSAIDLDLMGGGIYWAGSVMFGGLLRTANLFGDGAQEFGAAGKSPPGGVVVQSGDRTLYYTDASDCVPLCGSIRTVLLDGSADQATTMLNEPDAIDVDAARGRMCWSDHWDDWLRCSDLSAGNAQTVVAGARVEGVAIDPVTGKVYWIDGDARSIRRANTDGTHVETLVAGGLVQPRDLDLDPVGRKLYWSDPGSWLIQRASLDGVGVETVLVASSGLRGIALAIGQGLLRLRLDRDDLRWSRPPGAGAFDVVRGDLAALRTLAGDFSATTSTCVADDAIGSQLGHGTGPGRGEGVWFLVRGVTATGNGTYDTGGLSQHASRDAGVAASAADCL